MTAATGHPLTTPAVLDRMAFDYADHEALVAPPVAPAPPAPPPIEATVQLPPPKATRAPRAPKGETIVPTRRAPSQASPGPTKPQRTPEQVLAHRPLKPPGKTKAGWP